MNIFTGDRGHSNEHLMKHSTIYISNSVTCYLLHLTCMGCRLGHVTYNTKERRHDGAAGEKIILQCFFVF